MNSLSEHGQEFWNASFMEYLHKLSRDLEPDIMKLCIYEESTLMTQASFF